MANERKGLRKGQAHVEYLALKSTIEQLAAAGHNLKAIHEMLKAEGRISMSYQALHENMTRAERRKRSGRKAEGSVQAAQWRESVAPVPPKEQNQPLRPSPPTVQLKDLDEALEEAAALREKSPKQSGKEGQGYSRKKVIG